MPYENSAGLGVNNFYGPRTAVGARGPDVSSGVLNEYVWFYDTATTNLGGAFLIPAGSAVVDVNAPSNVTAVTIGGTAVQGATWAAPVTVTTGGAPVVTGATAGQRIVITYQKVVGNITVA